jgi:hypothetical protein
MSLYDKYTVRLVHCREIENLLGRIKRYHHTVVFIRVVLLLFMLAKLL